MCYTDYLVKVDETSPKCSVTINGTKGKKHDGKQWYIESNPTASLSTVEKTSGIAKESLLLNEYTEFGPSSIKLQHNDEGWIYGTVIDNAGRKGYCSSEHIAVDIKPPVCKWEGQSTTWTSDDRTIRLYCDSDDGSGCKDSSFWSNTYKTDTKTNSQSHKIADYAGNEKICREELNVYVDKTPPTLYIDHSTFFREEGTGNDKKEVEHGKTKIYAWCGVDNFSGRQSYAATFSGTQADKNKCTSEDKKTCHHYTDTTTNAQKATRFTCCDKVNNCVTGYRKITCYPQGSNKEPEYCDDTDGANIHTN